MEKKRKDILYKRKEILRKFNLQWLVKDGTGQQN